MPKRSAPSGAPQRVVWSAPFRKLAQELRREAEHIRRLIGNDPRAADREKLANQIEAALRDAESCEWISTDDAAEILGIHPDSMRARCRRVLRPAGQAEKRGGLWYVHRNAVERPSRDARTATAIERGGE